MGLFDFLRRGPPIRDVPSLTDFIGRNAAFLAQKGLYEYSRARAGHYSKVLFAETQFQQAIEHARWRAYPLALAMVAEAAEAVVHERVGGERAVILQTVRRAALDAFDQFPVPDALGQGMWQELRSELDRRLMTIGMHPAKRAMDIPLQYAQSYFDLMPIHEKLRKAEFPTLRSYLQVTLCNISNEFAERIDGPAMARELSAAKA